MQNLSPRRTGTLNVPSIDGFRGLAVLFIVLGHCWDGLGGRVQLDGGPIRNVFVSSFAGVDMLFIVSGFVLFLPVAINGTLGSTRSYAIRRAARILPAFYAALVISYVVARSVGELHASAGSWITHLLFLHTEAHHIDHVGFGVNGAMWTMSVEVMFYVALPFLAVAYRRHPFVGLAIAISAAELWHVAALRLPDLVDAAGWTWSATAQAQVRMALAFPSYLGHFALGMTAAWIYVHLKRMRTTPRFDSTAFAVQVAAALGAITVLYIRGMQGMADTSGPIDHWVKTFDRSFFFTALLLATALAPERARRAFENPVSRSLGLASYGTYLIHQSLINVMIPALGLEKGTTSNMDLLRLMLAVTPLSILIGVLSYAFIEEPFRRWARQKTPHRRTEPLARCESGALDRGSDEVAEERMRSVRT